jgi:hypothetical protein
MVPESAYANALPGLDALAEPEDGRELVQYSSHGNVSTGASSSQYKYKMAEDGFELAGDDVCNQENNAVHTHNEPTKRRALLKKQKKESHAKRLSRFQDDTREVKKDRATRRLDNRKLKKELKKEARMEVAMERAQAQTRGSVPTL